MSGVTRACKIVHQSVELVFGLRFLHSFCGHSNASLAILLNYLVQLAHTVLDNHFGTLCALQFSDDFPWWLLLAAHYAIVNGLRSYSELLVITWALGRLHQIIDSLLLFRFFSASFPFLFILVFLCRPYGTTFIRAGSWLNFYLEFWRNCNAISDIIASFLLLIHCSLGWRSTAIGVIFVGDDLG